MMTIDSEKTRIKTDSYDYSIKGNSKTGNIEFFWHGYFDRNTGEYEEIFGEFDFKMFQAGITELKKSGECKIIGKNCQIGFRQRNDFFQVLYQGQDGSKIIEISSENLEQILVED